VALGTPAVLVLVEVGADAPVPVPDGRGWLPSVPVGRRVVELAVEVAARSFSRPAVMVTGTLVTGAFDDPVCVDVVEEVPLTTRRMVPEAEQAADGLSVRYTQVPRAELGGGVRWA